MELRNLVYFVQVFEDKNYSAAAGKLFITQQALSKSIKSLEAELGTPLFKKVPFGVTPTPYAETIYPICKEMRSHFEAGLHKIHSISPEGLAPIRLAISYQTMETISPTLVEDFLLTHPDCPVQYDGYPDLSAEQRAADGLCDFVFTVGLPEKNDLFQPFLMKKMPLCVMVGPKHPLYHKEILWMKDLDQLELHCAGPQFKTYHLLKAKAHQAEIQLRLIPTSGYLFSTYKNIFDTDGAVIGLVGSEESPEFKDIRMIPFADKELNWDIYFACLRDHPLNPNEKTFLEHVLSYRTADYK